MLTITYNWALFSAQVAIQNKMNRLAKNQNPPPSHQMLFDLFLYVTIRLGVCISTGLCLISQRIADKTQCTKQGGQCNWKEENPTQHIRTQYGNTAQYKTTNNTKTEEQDPKTKTNQDERIRQRPTQDQENHKTRPSTRPETKADINQ